MMAAIEQKDLVRISLLGLLGAKINASECSRILGPAIQSGDYLTMLGIAVAAPANFISGSLANMEEEWPIPVVAALLDAATEETFWSSGTAKDLLFKSVISKTVFSCFFY